MAVKVQFSLSLNDGGAVRMTAMSSAMRTSSNRDERACDISGFMLDSVLQRSSVPYLYFTKRRKSL